MISSLIHLIAPLLNTRRCTLCNMFIQVYMNISKKSFLALQSVVDAITVQIPFIGKKLMDAITSIVSSMKHMLTHPMQALSGLGKSVME